MTTSTPETPPRIELRELTRKAATGEATAVDANAIKDLADKRRMLLKAGPNVQDML